MLCLAYVTYLRVGCRVPVTTVKGPTIRWVPGGGVSVSVTMNRVDSCWMLHEATLKNQKSKIKKLKKINKNHRMSQKPKGRVLNDAVAEYSHLEC